MAMDALKDYGQYWFVTITPYGRDIEPNVPDKEKVMEDFKRLSDVVGVDSMGWRCDPILITDRYPVERHIADFEHMAKTLSGYTESCVISFIDLYQKVRRNFPEAREVHKEDRIAIGKAFAEIGRTCGMWIPASPPSSGRSGGTRPALPSVCARGRWSVTPCLPMFRPRTMRTARISRSCEASASPSSLCLPRRLSCR